MGDGPLDLLVRACWPDLVRTGYLLTGSLPAAEDLARDALRRRLRGSRDPVPETELRDAVVREAFRRRSLYAAGSAPFAELGGSAAVLRQLPLDERAVLVLRHREGLSVEQAVDVLHVPAGVVREREDRAVRTTAALQTGPDALRALLAAAADTVTPSAPPDLDSLLETAQGRRVLVLGLVALAVALLAVARWLL